jgi:hypothetical protein
MISIFCFYILLLVLLIVYFFYHKNQFTKELVITLAIKVNLIVLLYILFFSQSHRVQINDVMLNNLLK